MAERRIELREQIRVADDPERMWPVNDMVDAVGLIVVVRDWRTGLNKPSSTEMKHMAEFFSGLEWWTLEPRPELILNQSGDWTKHMVLAKSATGDLVVAYLPVPAEPGRGMNASVGALAYGSTGTGRWPRRFVSCGRGARLELVWGVSWSGLSVTSAPPSASNLTAVPQPHLTR